MNNDRAYRCLKRNDHTVSIKGRTSGFVFAEIFMVKQAPLLPFRLEIPQLCSHTAGMNEFTGTPETVEEALQLHHRISSNALFILFLCSHKHDTKPGALLFIVHRGRLALSWMGWIRYVLPVCMPALRLSHSEALQQGTDMAMLWHWWPSRCIYK